MTVDYGRLHDTEPVPVVALETAAKPSDAPTYSAMAG